MKGLRNVKAAMDGSLEGANSEDDKGESWHGGEG